MKEELCPRCSSALDIKDRESYHYDPLVSVDVLLYHCPACGYEKSEEYLRQM